MIPHISQILLVSAAVIRKDHKLLLCSRPQYSKHYGFWEFPGGKINPDENPQSALNRELKEELNADAIPLDIIFQKDSFDKKIIRIFFLRTFLKNSENLHGREGQEFRWLTINELSDYKILSPDLACIKFIFHKF